MPRTVPGLEPISVEAAHAKPLHALAAGLSLRPASKPERVKKQGRTFFQRYYQAANRTLGAAIIVEAGREDTAIIRCSTIRLCFVLRDDVWWPMSATCSTQHPAVRVYCSV